MLANFNAMLPFGNESFTFPINCNQVFFSDAEDEPSWKVVLRTEVRGHRVDSEMDEEEEVLMFRIGENADFGGLHHAAEIVEGYQEPLQTGRDIQMNDILGQGIEEEAAMFDRDVGESSEDEG